MKLDISDIFAGWAVLTIGDCSFTVSYLSDVRKELDYLFCLDSFYDVKTSYLEGEDAGDLRLVTFLTRGENEDIINIMWNRVFSYEDSIITMSFSYEQLKARWKEVKENIEAVYDRDFLMREIEEE